MIMITNASLLTYSWKLSLRYTLRTHCWDVNNCEQQVCAINIVASTVNIKTNKSLRKICTNSASLFILWCQCGRVKSDQSVRKEQIMNETEQVEIRMQGSSFPEGDFRNKQAHQLVNPCFIAFEIKLARVWKTYKLMDSQFTIIV